MEKKPVQAECGDGYHDACPVPERCGCKCHEIAERPRTFTEARERQIARWERDGLLDPTCSICQEWFYARTDTMPRDVFAPRHRAGLSCRSGSRPHCSCGSCF